MIPGILSTNQAVPYGDTLSYQLGRDWLFPACKSVEDWGAGRGWFARYVPEECQYRGIDVGVDLVRTPSPFVDVVADLSQYRSQTDGIFMRHVLEHNYNWNLILENALQSATKRIFISIFTPWSGSTEPEVLLLAGPPEFPLHDPPVPSLGLVKEQVLDLLMDYSVTEASIESDTYFRQEQLLYIEIPQ